MKKILFIFSLVIVIAGCKKDGANCNYLAGTSVAPANERTQVSAYLSSKNITNAIELESCGIFYIIDAPGNGSKPSQCSYITIKYAGEYEDGTIFDQTTGTNTASFSLGQLIEGWKRGLPLIGVGGKIRLYIPPTLGYGPAGVFNSSTGVYTIRANAMLIFNVEIVGITN